MLRFMPLCMGIITLCFAAAYVVVAHRNGVVVSGMSLAFRVDIKNISVRCPTPKDNMGGWNMFRIDDEVKDSRCWENV